MIAQTERRITRMRFRLTLFARRGLAAPAAEKWVDRLAQRDADLDDRRLCIECTHWRHHHLCAIGMPGVPFLLARCAGFEWVTP